MVSPLKKAMELKPLSKILGDKSASPKVAKKKESALKALMDLCQDDRVVLAVLGAHGKTVADLHSLYQKLAVNNGAKWAGNHFVVASTVAFGRTLDYTLTSLADGKDLRKIAFDLEEYFLSERMGPVVVGYGKVA